MMKIEKPRVAIFSDLHLGKHNNSADWHNIAIEWCDWFIDQLNEKKIKDVIFCGDWHDNRSEISVHTLDVSAMLIDKFKDFNLHMVVGNHDIPYKHGTEINSVSVFANRPNIKIYTQLEYLEAFDRTLCFAPWDSDLRKLDKCTAIFGHLEIQSFKMGLAKTCDRGWSVIDLLAKCEKVYSGHFHIRNEVNYNEGTITYVGNPFQMDFGDRYDDKGFYVLNLDSMSHEFIENNLSPVHHRIKLSDILDKGLDTFKLKIVGNMIKLDIDVDYDTTKLYKVYDEIEALAPKSFTHDYTYQSEVGTDDFMLSAVDTSIDVRQQIEEYVDAVDLYGKEKCKEYLIELYEKSRV